MISECLRSILSNSRAERKSVAREIGVACGVLRATLDYDAVEMTAKR